MPGSDGHKGGMEGVDQWLEKGKGTRTGRNVILKPNHYILLGLSLYFDSVCVVSISVN